MSTALWSRYAKAVVDFHPDGVAPFTLRPVPGARCPAGDWPWGDRDRIHVITAWNPGSERPAARENAARQRVLDADLVERNRLLALRRGAVPDR